MKKRSLMVVVITLVGLSSCKKVAIDKKEPSVTSESLLTKQTETSSQEKKEK